MRELLAALDGAYASVSRAETFLRRELTAARVAQRNLTVTMIAWMSKLTSMTDAPRRRSSRFNAVVTRTSSSYEPLTDSQQPAGKGDGASQNLRNCRGRRSSGAVRSPQAHTSASLHRPPARKNHSFAGTSARA